jgi:hypothetical protein
MQNHLTYEQLALYAEHLKNNTLEQCPEDLRAHVEHCDQCAIEAAELCTLTDEIQIQVKPKQALFGKQRYLFVLAAAAAGVLMFVAIWFLVDTSGSEQNYLGETLSPELTDTSALQTIPESFDAENDNKHSSTESKAEDSSENSNIMFGENVPQQTDVASVNSERYAEHKPTEMLVQNFRGNMRSTHIEILSPAEFKVADNTDEHWLVLRWKNNTKMQLTVELLNNFGEIHIEYQTQGDSVIIEKLPHKGLYYWKLFNRDFDLLYCGKIIYR